MYTNVVFSDSNSVLFIKVSLFQGVLFKKGFTVYTRMRVGRLCSVPTCMPGKLCAQQAVNGSVNLPYSFINKFLVLVKTLTHFSFSSPYPNTL